MTSATKTELTATEKRDHHAAYHTSGMMEPGCQSCTEILRHAPAPFAFQDHYTQSYARKYGKKSN